MVFFGLFGFSLAGIVVRAWLILIPASRAFGSFFAKSGDVGLVPHCVLCDGGIRSVIFVFVLATSGYLPVFSYCSRAENSMSELSEKEILRPLVKRRFHFGLNVHKKNTKNWNLERIKT
ncbi:MAG: hypothetical protein ACYC6S_03450 [Desulfobulbia bacterium]